MISVLSLQAAPVVNFSAVTSSALLPVLCVTVWITAVTTAMNKSALWLPAKQDSSAAGKGSAFQRNGCVMDRVTVLIIQMNLRIAVALKVNLRRWHSVGHKSFAVATASVFTWTGDVMETRTARTSLMRKIAVSTAYSPRDWLHVTEDTFWFKGPMN